MNHTNDTKVTHAKHAQNPAPRAASAPNEYTRQRKRDAKSIGSLGGSTYAERMLLEQIETKVDTAGAIYREALNMAPSKQRISIKSRATKLLNALAALHYDAERVMAELHELRLDCCLLGLGHLDAFDMGTYMYDFCDPVAVDEAFARLRSSGIADLDDTTQPQRVTLLREIAGRSTMGEVAQ